MAKTTQQTRVLGRGVLTEVWKDMVTMTLPSWVTGAPKEVGSARHGKLSADQWRSTCTINLTYTLIRLWGHKPKESREYRMLSNYLDLVAATKLASMRTMSTQRIHSFRFYMVRYLREMLNLYPGTSMTPNHHLSLHLGKLLERYGPTHAWRCFSFERYNYLLQRINTNSRVGALQPSFINDSSCC